MNFDNLAAIYKDELNYIRSQFNKDSIDFYKDELLIAIDNAWRAIASYLWIDFDESNIRDIKDKFQTVIVHLAVAYYNNYQIQRGNLKGVLYVTQQTQGSRSVTYRSNVTQLDSNGLTEEVKAALPPRKLRVL